MRVANSISSVDEVDGFSVFDFNVLSLSVDFLDVLGKNSFFGVVHFSELGRVDFWSLNDFNFSNFNVLYGVDMGDFLGDFLFDYFRSEQVQNLGGVGLNDLFSDDFVHLSSDGLLLRRLGVVSFSLLSIGFSGEGNGENSQNVSVGSFAILDSFDEGFSFFNKRAEFVSGHINTVE